MTNAPTVTASAQGPVQTIRIDRPTHLNSLDLATKSQLLAALQAAADDPDVRAVVLTGTARAFCVGQDLDEARTADGPDAMADAVREHYGPLVRTLLTMPKPVIAAVNGVAAGAGMALALACDFRIAATSATFTTAFAGIGLSCDTGISWTLPRIAGRAAALDLLLHPRLLNAAEALDLGLLHQVTADENLDAKVQRSAAALAAGPTHAFAAIKAAVTFASESTLDAALEHEATQIARTGASDDYRLGLDAFLAKQKPSFTGR
ncbi:enoyl-CoA hydratase-related protein [Streptomyces cinnabarinus]|uniref:Enoyl-CoA hydratase-related protein n=1 Tax=Streptomyces cinnabarinus TaxID=67287 RepID=A0ABY7K6Z9_9ACTN|nr:enoyl-CoA hydratase-related protein [Streptomyces cinnabarinus]WAZ19047.1 enoyl-CoA hydratase-related protein [Streptomyces cinnabarinus]